jgi:site-specific DNA recombinase
MTKRAAVYARVSTDEQAKGYSLNTQVDACSRYAAERGYQAVETYKEDYSGATLDRPELDKLRDAISSKRVEVVIVYDIDRLARKSAYQVLIEEEFFRNGVLVEYVIGQYDDSDEGRLQKQIRASIAEYEKAKILERSKRGKRGKANSGFVIVGARPPYGYQVRSEPHKAWLEVDEDEAKIVKMVFQWYLYGDGKSSPLSMLSIATRLTNMGIPTRGDKQTHVAKKRDHGVWSAGVIRNILANEAYTGTWHYGKTKMISDGREQTRKAKPKCGFGKQVARPKEEWIPVPVPAFISPIDYKRASEMMEKNREQSKRQVRQQYLMGRRLKCSKCGYSYVGKSRQGKHTYYYCKGREQKPVCLCDMPIFRCNLIDDAVWLWVRALIEEPEAFADGLRGLQEETRQKNRALFDRLELIESQLAETEKQENKFLDLYLSGDFPKEVLLERKNRLAKLTADLKKEQAELSIFLQQLTYSDVEIATIEDFCTKIRERLDTVTFEGKRRILEMLDVRGTLAIENDEKVIYLSCLIAPQPVSLALILPLSNTGVTATTSSASPPTARSQ